jgi:hypothetical protein
MSDFEISCLEDIPTILIQASDLYCRPATCYQPTSYISILGDLLPRPLLVPDVIHQNNQHIATQLCYLHEIHSFHKYSIPIIQVNEQCGRPIFHTTAQVPRTLPANASSIPLWLTKPIEQAQRYLRGLRVAHASTSRL